MPRPAPDLDARRRSVVDRARGLAETEGWTAVTMRRLGSDLGLTLPLLYTVVDGRQGVVDAVAREGFTEIAQSLRRSTSTSPDRAAVVTAYLAWARRHPATYQAMFERPTGLSFGSDTTPSELTGAFAAVREAIGGTGDHQAEVAWALLHGLAVLERDGRLPARGRRDREAAAVTLLDALR